MKLVLKIAAGIIVAWVAILVGGFFLAIGTAKVVSEAVVQPQVEQLTQPFEQLAQVPTYQPEQLTWIDISWTECHKRDGKWGYIPGQSIKVACGVEQ